MTNSCETVGAVITSVARLITKHLAIPNECLSLVWSKPQDHHVQVTIVLIPRSEESPDYLDVQTGSRGGCTCMVCCHPCKDADDDPDPKARERNCVECHPCNLCDRCRVTMANGTSKCYLCLGPEDLSFLEERHSNDIIRLRVLAPDIFSSPTS